MKRKFLKVRDIAEIFGVHYLTARAWCQEGKLKAVKIGRDWYVPITELERLGLKSDDAE